MHMAPTTMTGDELQLVVRISVDGDGAGCDLERHPAVRAVRGHGPQLGRPTAAEGLDLVEVCANLTRSVGDDDLTAAMTVVAGVAGCPAVLLRPDRSLLAAGEPRASTSGPAPHRWHWAANGPRADRDIVVCAGTRRLGIVTFQQPVPNPTAPVWGIVHDLLALALLGRDAHRRAESAELQAALFACLSDEDRDPPSARSGQFAYRPAVITPITDTPWSPDMFARLHLTISEQPLLAAGRCARVEDRTVCLYPQPTDSDPRDDADAWRRALAAAAPLRCRVVVGTADARGAGLRDSYRTARWLADLQAAPTPGLCVADVAVVDELGVVAGTLGPDWGPRLGHFVRRVLGDLLDSPRFGGEMVDTLHAYLVRGGSPPRPPGCCT